MTTQATDPNTKDTQDQKLIAGKYKTVEDAEAAIKEAERKMHAATQEASGLRAKVQELEGGLRTSGRDDGGGDAGDDDEEEFARVFLHKPRTVLGRLGKQIREQAVKEALAHSTVYVETRFAVEAFMQQKPLSRKHTKLFNSFLSETDPQKSVEDRLADAYTSLEGELGKISQDATKNQDAQRKANQKVDAMAGADDEGALAGRKAAAETDYEPESPQDYIKSRKAAYVAMQTA